MIQDKFLFCYWNNVRLKTIKFSNDKDDFCVFIKNISKFINSKIYWNTFEECSGLRVRFHFCMLMVLGKSSKQKVAAQYGFKRYPETFHKIQNKKIVLSIAEVCLSILLSFFRKYAGWCPIPVLKFTLPNVTLFPPDNLFGLKKITLSDTAGAFWPLYQLYCNKNFCNRFSQLSFTYSHKFHFYTFWPNLDKFSAEGHEIWPFCGREV